MTRWAEMSDDGLYRYVLGRRWGPSPGLGRFVYWVLLNPSTADAEVDDPTVRRCVGYARDWGYDGIEIRNLFSYRATDPSALLRAADPIGPEGNDALLALDNTGPDDLVIVGWGSSGMVRPQIKERAETVARGLLEATHRTVWCLGLTASGHPRHPLYLKRTEQPYPFWGYDR